MIPLIIEDELYRTLPLEYQGSRTIRNEIVFTLQRLNDYLEEQSKLYNSDGQVNQEFVRKFTKNK